MNLEDLMDRLKEPSTWKGIAILLAVFGARLSPEDTANFVLAGMAVSAMINVMRSETKATEKVVEKALANTTNTDDKTEKKI